MGAAILAWRQQRTSALLSARSAFPAPGACSLAWSLPPTRGPARLTRVSSSSSQESAPRQLTHRGRWGGDTTPGSNYNTQLTYEFDELKRRWGGDTLNWRRSLCAGTFSGCKNSLIGCSHAPARALHWLSRHATGARRGLGDEQREPHWRVPLFKGAQRLQQPEKLRCTRPGV